MMPYAYSAPVGAPKKILIIDDDEDFRSILGTKLQMTHLTVITAVNGREGIEKAHQYHPDLILLDVDMPVMNGIETFRALKADPTLQELDVVFLTNYDEPRISFPDASALEQQQLRATGYIRKSTDLDVIAAYVEGVLLAKKGGI
jgi:two-component system alkaline phosphatase synthesis response regulator PhoP